MRAKVTVGIFLVLLALLSVFNLLVPSKAFSENENRYLQQLPEFSVDSLVSGEFTADFDLFLIDQFIFRDGWVGLKTICEQLLLRKSANGVYFADDQYLIEMFDKVDKERFSKNVGMVEAFSRRVQSNLPVCTHTLLAPTASMILADKLPANAPEVDQRGLLSEAQTSIPGFVDVSDALLAHKDESIYYRTDHHWTTLGAFYAYEVWREALGLAPLSTDAYEITPLSSDFYGTTYSKANLYTVPPDTLTAFYPKQLGPVVVDYNNGVTVTDTIYERSFLEKKDKYSVFFNANQPITKIITENKNAKRLLMVKDSYANCFAQLVLQDYEEIVLLDLRYFKMSVYDYIEENGITDVLLLYSVNGFSASTDLYYLTV